MKLFVCTDFQGRWPVGVCALIVAEGKFAAERLLVDELARLKLPQEGTSSFTLTEIDTSKVGATVLLDGDY